MNEKPAVHDPLSALTRTTTSNHISSSFARPSRLKYTPYTKSPTDWNGRCEETSMSSPFLRDFQSALLQEIWALE